VKLILASAIVASWQVNTDTGLSSASDRRLSPILSPISVEFKLTAKVTAFSIIRRLLWVQALQLIIS
jgi:hypothetical protein